MEGVIKVGEKIPVFMRDISKSFPGVRALDSVSLRLEEGEVKALVGENGAGKSTLIKILTGAYSQDSGEIFVFGRKIDRMDPILSEKLGISAVYQNLVLADHLTVAENIFLGSLPTRFGFVDKKELFKCAQKILSQIGYEGIIDPKEKVGNLTASQQEMVAIARALSRDVRVIIFDEPTAVLAAKEVEELFRVIRWLKETGRSVIYISHRLDEIFDLCDNVLVLKD
jgi:ribose transport system ATP-binding protein